jgi:GNAT superfamily N-acetyltransferase
MFWRLERSQFKAQKGVGNREALKELMAEAPAPGLLAYSEAEAIGWCGLGPRASLVALERSRILRRVDDRPVWSVVCFFIGRTHRRQGVARALLKGAISYARDQGAVALEGYPIDLDAPQLVGQRLTSYSGYMGIASSYRALGFREAGRASETQLIMRYELEALREAG